MAAEQTWAVTGQKETTVVNSSGEYEPAMQVNFKTAKGVKATHTFPKSQYSAEHVKKVVGEHAKQIDEVHDLTGSSTASSSSAGPSET